ncbi:MAG: serine protease, partial [Chitinophagaceae bacterium]
MLIKLLIQYNFMLTTSTGLQVSSETIIFPLFTFDANKLTFRCRGTGFFITQIGGFITAKHVFFENDGSHLPTMYGIQSLDNGMRIVREVVALFTHNNADIAIGTLNSKAYDQPIVAPFVPQLMISTKDLNPGDDVITFAYPSTKTDYPSDTKTQFTFLGNWSDGKIVDYHPSGMNLLRNACYQTTIHLGDGASGGPVFSENLVVGVNSTGMDVGDGEEPISGI